jgi:hypothetical protein
MSAARFGQFEAYSEYLNVAAFEIEELERSKWGIVERVAARKPVE